MRKLATAALSFSAAIFLANYVFPTGWLILPAVLSAVLGAILALLRRNWLRPAAVALLFFALGLTEYDVYCRCTVGEAERLDGETIRVTGTVIDAPDVYDDYCRLRMRVEEGELKHRKVIVYDYDKTLTDAEPGLRLVFTARVRSAGTLYGKPYDNYYVNGFYEKLTIRGEAERLETRFDLRLLPVKLRLALCRRIDRVFPQEGRAFLKALMLGDKQEFYQDDALYVSMSRAGLMHVVAVSGLHIAFLVGILLFLMGNGRAGAVSGIVVVWVFVLVTGCGKAAVRAAFMQSLLLMAPILRRENDPLTSLSAVLALLLAVCPLAAKSVSLQLSFGAMAGILCFFQPIYRFLMPHYRAGSFGAVLRYAAAVLSSSLSVMAFTIPITAIHFGYVPLLSFLVNIACLWAVSACFSLAWFACLLSPVPLLGPAVAWICTLLFRYIRFCAGLVAHAPFSVLYTQTKGSGLWIALCYGLLAWALLYKGKRLLRFILPAALSLAVLAAVLVRADRHYQNQDTMTVLDVGQGQCITAFAGDVTFMVDCGNTYHLDNAGEIAGEYLLSCGRDRVHVLMLTHLHEDHADGVVRLMEMLPVETLILPAETEDPDRQLPALLDAARRHGTEVVELKANASVERGRLGMDIYYVPGGIEENERCLMATLHIGETDLLITGDSPQRVERMLVRQVNLSGTEILVAGHHGSRFASSEELLQEAGGQLAVISVGYNTYGHPAEETLERLAENGYTVLRTDQNGTVELAIGERHGKKEPG